MLFALLVVCLLLLVVLKLVGATIVSLIWALLVGLVLGTVARVIAPGSGRMGCLTTSLVGLLGGLIGTALARSLDTGGPGRLLLQVASAVVLVLVLRPRRAAP